MDSLDKESIDLVVTSPPYDNLRAYNGYGKGWCKDKFERIAIGLIRALKNGGVIVWVVNDKVEKGSKTMTHFEQCQFFVKNGLNLNDEMIWRKTNPMPQVKQKRYTQCFEHMFVFSKGQPKTFNPIMIPTKNGGKHYKSTAKKITDENERRELDYHVNCEMVDYNIYPSYLLTELDTTKLIDSPSSSYIYSSVYDVWKEDIINSYNKVIVPLKQVSGASFVKREKLDKQVYKNTYDNGKYIIINYSNEDIVVDGRTVSALSSEVFEA